ncbi:hypothetical protein Anas_12871 [Armadillidium nasatum]|uniref:Uncharacterized protein n=1 Tax=Armadillidium nasatum TaxID=96803 RepID=A0A5N5T6F2_9CRUS|nr:hypothetical protein Anas_12871 [Armadillidium nasatum]
MFERKSSAKNKIEVRGIEKKDLLNDQICGNQEGTFSTFIDVNSEIDVKEEPFDFKEEDVMADKLCDQVLGLHENQQEKTFTFIDINSEIKINDVPSYIKEEEELNDPFFEKIPGLDENQMRKEMTTSKRELEQSEEKNAGLLKRKKIISQLPESASSDEDFDRSSRDLQPLGQHARQSRSSTTWIIDSQFGKNPNCSLKAQDKWAITR